MSGMLPSLNAARLRTWLRVDATALATFEASPLIAEIAFGSAGWPVAPHERNPEKLASRSIAVLIESCEIVSEVSWQRITFGIGSLRRLFPWEAIAHSAPELFNDPSGFCSSARTGTRRSSGRTV